LEPIENPKYIIERRGLLLERFITKDYHAVPEIFGGKKEHAELFAKIRGKYVSKFNMIYAMTLKGRRALLKTRKKSFLASVNSRLFTSNR
jgi:hypothetical protein